MLEIKNLKIQFSQKQYQRPAVDIEALQIQSGEVLGILGESGSGKTLLSLAIMGLLPANCRVDAETQIYFHGVDLAELSEVNMQKLRGTKISMIFQEPMTSLNPVLTVGSQIAEVLLSHRICPKFEVKSKTLELMRQVELNQPEKLYGKYPHELSGGMKQRIMIAMALAGEPELLIADEPTSALDIKTQAEILTLLKQLQKKNNLTIMCISHDVSVVKQIADRVAVIYAGKLMEVSNARDFFKEALHPYSQCLLQSLPSKEQRGFTLPSIEGVVPTLTSTITGCVFNSRCPKVISDCHKTSPELRVYKEREVACLRYKEILNEVLIKPSKFETGPNSEGIILSVDNLKVYFSEKSKWFSKEKNYTKAVDDLSFKLKKGKTTAIVGESGCGKTTLAKCLVGLLKQTEGDIHFPETKTARKKFFRKYVQMIFQDPFSSLNPRMLVGDIIAEGLAALRLGNSTYKKNKVTQLIKQMGLPEDSATRYPHEFSGGQRQRISIARALAVEPQLIICDEPTSALDVSVQAQIINLLKRLQIQYELTYLFITHDMDLVSYLADEVILMQKGKILKQGPINEVLNTENFEKNT